MRRIKQRREIESGWFDNPVFCFNMLCLAKYQNHEFFSEPSQYLRILHSATTIFPSSMSYSYELVEIVYKLSIHKQIFCHIYFIQTSFENLIFGF